VGKFFLPIGLSLVYPSVQIDSSQAIWWAPLILFGTAGIVLWYMHRTFAIWELLWGMGFYGVNLVPTSGFVQWKGMEELYVADHYQYIAMIGLATVSSLGLAALVQGFWRKNAIRVEALISCGVILPLALASSLDLRTWQNSETLWLRVIENNPGNYTARYNYGHYLQSHARIDEAVAQYRHAISIGSDRVFNAYFNLGGILLESGMIDEAKKAFETAVESNPRFWPAHASLANLYFRKGDYKKALEHCVQTARLGGACRPDAIQKAMEKPGNP